LKKVYLRSRGGGKQGWGNIYRLITIYELIKKKYDCLFIFEGNQEVANFVKKKKIKYIRLKENISLNQEQLIIDRLDSAHLSIIEMLDCSYSRQKIYKKKSNKLIVFDDILNKRYCADQVISGQYKSKLKKIKNLRSGYEFYPLKKEFENYKNKKKKIKKQIEKVLICLGGSSYNLGNEKMYNFFKNKNYRTTIIKGDEQKKLNFKTDSKNTNILFKNKSKNLAKLIYESDIVITGGGYIKIETAFLKTPMLVLPVQRHQLELVKDFKKYCSVPFLNYSSRLNNRIIELFFNKYNYKYRYQMNKTLSNKFRNNVFKKKVLSLITNQMGNKK
jgi:UDP-2,4-diacetamido-2,4,6-trideoxy-beta-L-altropyranose hydrolase